MKKWILPILGGCLITAGVGMILNAGKSDNPCAAEKLTAEQNAYVKYRTAVGRWGYETGTTIDMDAIDSIYYFKLNK